MGMPRTPLHLAVATGRVEHDKKRYEGLEMPDNPRLGGPSEDMTMQEQALWLERLEVFWWLSEQHRDAFANWIIVTAKLRDPENRENIDQFVKLVNLQTKLGRLIGADPSSDQVFGKQQRPTGKAAFSRRA